MPRDFGNIIYNYKCITYPTDGVSAGSVLCKEHTGVLVGVFCTAAANTPLLTIYDNNARATGTVITAAFTPAAATLYQFGQPVKFLSGLYVLSSGSVGCTIIYE
jgi:hypothetical protein